MGLLDYIGKKFATGEGLTDEDRRAAARQGLLQLGATLLSTPSNGSQGFGQGLLAGVGGVRDAGENIIQGRQRSELFGQQKATREREQKTRELQSRIASGDQAAELEYKTLDPMGYMQFKTATDPNAALPSDVRTALYFADQKNAPALAAYQTMNEAKRTPQYGTINGTPIQFGPNGYTQVPAAGGAPQGMPQPAPMLTAGAPPPPPNGPMDRGSAMSYVQQAEQANGSPFPVPMRKQMIEGLMKTGTFDTAAAPGVTPFPPSPPPAPSIPLVASEPPINASSAIKAAWPEMTPDQRKRALVGDATGQKPTSATDLRKEFDAQTKDYKVIQDQVKKIEASAGKGAAGDMSLIFAYMKMLDPGSTVREGEYASAKNTTGIPGQIINAYNQAKDGTFLNDAQREQFASQAKAIAEQSRATFGSTADQYRRLAREQGLNPEDVVFDPYAQAVAPKKAPGAAGYDPLGLLK